MNFTAEQQATVDFDPRVTLRPDVQRSSLPNVYIAGMPKAGTSALTHFLRSHPQFSVSAIKEPNYFNTDMRFELFTTEAAYLDQFKSDIHPEPAFRCDGSILYCYSTVAAARIAAAVPYARAVIMLRNPVDVMQAWHAQMCFTGNEPVSDFATALKLESERRRTESTAGLVGLAARCPQLLWYRHLVRYAEQIARFHLHLGKSNVLLLTYEDFTRSPATVYANMLQFLGADASHQPAYERINESRTRSWPTMHRCVKRAVAGPSMMMPRNLRYRLIRYWDAITSAPAQRSPLPRDLRRRLLNDTRCETDAVSELLGRELSEWRD